jgi:galactofuranose transport system ATP-binding protein
VICDWRTVLVHQHTNVDAFQLVAAMLWRDSASVRAAGRPRAALRGEGTRQGNSACPRPQDRSSGASARIAGRAGEIVGLAGLLGSGRSEVVRAIVGADPPDGGRIRILNQETAPATPADAIRNRIGYCSEVCKRDGIMPEMVVRENLTLVLLPQSACFGIVR